MLTRAREEDSATIQRITKEFDVLVKLDGEARHERARPLLLPRLHARRAAAAVVASLSSHNDFLFSEASCISNNVLRMRSADCTVQLPLQARSVSRSLLRRRAALAGSLSVCPLCFLRCFVSAVLLSTVAVLPAVLFLFAPDALAAGERLFSV